VTTHDYNERVNTVRAAKKAGLEVCSGGILGMGESWQDRMDMALLLKELDVDSVPLNFLVPIKGTPLGSAGGIAPFDAIRAIALFRMILADKTIKIVAGRETVLKDFQGMIYAAGANGMMVGGYLTIAGRPVEADQGLIREIARLWNEE
jgi:biotin synthase